MHPDWRIINRLLLVCSVGNKEFEKWNWVSFWPVLTLWNGGQHWPYWLSRTEVRYCTFGLGTIIWRNLRTFSLLRDSPRNNLYLCVIKVKTGKANRAKQNDLTGFTSYEKICRYNNSPPYVTARWPPQQIPPLISLVGNQIEVPLYWPSIEVTPPVKIFFLDLSQGVHQRVKISLSSKTITGSFWAALATFSVTCPVDRFN